MGDMYDFSQMQWLILLYDTFFFILPTLTSICSYFFLMFHVYFSSLFTYRLEGLEFKHVSKTVSTSKLWRKNSTRILSLH